MLYNLLMTALGVMLFCYIAQFVYALTKLKGGILFPATKKDLRSLWVMPQKPVSEPTFQGQRNGIIFHSLYLLFLIVTCFFIWLFHVNPMPIIYLLVLFPLLYTRNSLNLFAITDQGILNGVRFIRWEKLKSYDVIEIDVNHKYYGHSPEVNGEYEIKIHSKIFTLSCMTTSEETREKFISLLQRKQITERVNDIKNKVNGKEEYTHLK